eukprot:902703-Heterocapsa_arctica.AAC.1
MNQPVQPLLRLPGVIHSLYVAERVPTHIGTEPITTGWGDPMRRAGPEGYQHVTTRRTSVGRVGLIMT